MIRIKDYIFNENNIIQMCINENNNLEIDVNNGFPRVIKNANFSDIEWNYEDEQIRKCLESIDREEELENKIKELEEENKTLKELNVCVGCDNNPDYKTRIKELEEENKRLSKNQRYYKNGVFCLEYDKETMSDMIDDYKSRIDKTIEYIEENKQLFMFDNLRKDGTLQYTIECDADDLLKILKGEENE